MPLTVSAINALQDWFHRGAAAPALPGSWYYALLSAIPDSTNPNGVEVTTGGVARVAVVRDTNAWSGTQGAGSTGASNGTTTPGIVRNNAPVSFAASATASVTAVAVGLFSASSAGTCWEWEYITASGTPVSRTWAIGDVIAIPTSSASWSMS